MTRSTDLLLALIDKRIADNTMDVWLGGKLKELKSLPIDTKGEVGEDFIRQALEYCGYRVNWSRQTDRSNKHWDLEINDHLKVEVKTATIGKDGRVFQHEGFERDRMYDVVSLLDVAPNDIYLTVASKIDLPFNVPNAKFTVSPKKMHRRAHGIQYKWDLTLQDVISRRIETLEDVGARFAAFLE